LLEFDAVAAASHGIPQDGSSAADATDRNRPQDRIFVGRISASSKFLQISLAVAIKVARAVSRQITKVGNLPIIIHSVPVGVAGAEADHKYVALIVVVSCDKICGKALEESGAAIARDAEVRSSAGNQAYSIRVRCEPQ